MPARERWYAGPLTPRALDQQQTHGCQIRRGSDSGEPAAATMSGAAADLDCWLWNRPPVGQVERTADPAVLERFDRTITAAVN